MKIDFQTIQELVKNYKGEFLIELKDQMNGLIKIDCAFVRETQILFDIYARRYEIQRDLTKHDRIDGWKSLIPNLKIEAAIPNSITQLTVVITESFGYAIFSSPDFLTVFGVLKFKDLRVSRKAEIDELGQLKGNWAERQFFLAGKELNGI